MGVKNNIINQMLTDILFIQTSNSYTNNIDFTYKGWRALSDQSSFNMACIWAGPQDEANSNYNDGSPNTRIANINIDVHVKVTPTGEGNLDELIDSIELDLFKWLWKSSQVTTNKWNTFETAITGAGNFLLGNIVYTRNDEAGMALIQFPLRVVYQPNYK